MTDQSVVRQHPSASASNAEIEQRETAIRGAATTKQRRSVSIGVEGKTAGLQITDLFNQYAPLSYLMPWDVLDYVELLATYNPDYSQAVENVKMLANTGHTLFVEGGNRIAKQVKQKLEEKARKIQERHGGIDGLIEKLLDQACTFGAMCGEWIIDEDLEEVVDFIDVNPKYIRFFWEDDHWAPYQKVDAKGLEEAKARGQKVKNGNCIKLNELTFHYYAFDAAPGSPYGTPPFLASLTNIAIQRDMVQNMAQIVKKIGLLGIVDLTVKGLPMKPGESQESYEARAGAYLDAYVTVIEDMIKDGGIVHFDDVEANTWQIGGNAAGATAIFKQNEELIFSGLKSMPSVQGRSYCVVPNTRVLTADLRWVRAGDLALGDELIGFDEDLGKGRGRGSCAKMRRSVVEVNKRIRLDCVKVITDKGAITVSKQHPLVMKHRSQTDRVWTQAADLRPGDLLPWVGEPWEVDRSYESGYLAGMFDGEGTLGRSGSGKNGTVTMAQREGEVLDETVACLKELGFEPSVGPPTGGTNKDVSMVRILGGKFETLRFLGTVRPLRLLKKAHMTWEGAAIRNGGSVNQTGRKDAYAQVLAVEEVGRREVVALQTSTRTFIAEGLLNHNSTTETYAGVAYEIILRNTAKYQRSVRRMIEAGYWLMVSLWGDNPDKIKLKFNNNRELNRLQAAQAQKAEIENAVLLWALGLLDQQAVSQVLNTGDIVTEYSDVLDTPYAELQSKGQHSNAPAPATDTSPPEQQPSRQQVLDALFSDEEFRELLHERALAALTE